MDEETVLKLGDFCEQLLQNPNFQFLSAFFEQDAVGSMLSTKPQDTQAREEIYARISGHREFLTLMTNTVIEKNKLIDPPDQSDLDDPTVHDIYEGIFD